MQPQEFDNINAETSKVIFDKNFRKLSIKEIAINNNVGITMIRENLVKFKKNLKAIKVNNRRFLGKKKKLDKEKQNLIRDYLKENQFRLYKLNDIRLHLQQTTSDQLQVSNSTIWRVMKKEMGMSFKRVNKIHPSVITEETRRKIAESLNIQATLCLRGIDIIYWDEFKFSWHTSKHYGWAPRGRWGYKQLIPGKFQATFMLAFSVKKIYGVMATIGTFNAQKFIYFLSKIASTAQDKYAVIWDNSKVHVASEVKKYLREQELWIISIPPYWPYVNAWEKLILIIKQRIRMIERTGREINLRVFKQWIDRLNAEELEEWAKQSTFEALNIICK